MSQYFFALICTAWIVGAPALAAIEVPRLTGPVVDEAGIVPGPLKLKMEQALRDLSAQTGTQLNVLTVPSLQGETIEQFSIQVTDVWKLGSAKGDRGVLLLVAPKERKLRIEVGQGLEGDLTDVQANRIITDSITPLFKNGDLPSGILVGVFQIVKATDPTFNLAPYFEQGEPQVQPVSRKRSSDWFVIGLLIFFLFSGLFSGGRSRRRGTSFLPGLGGRSSGGFGGWGGGSSGGSSWGGGGGGFSGGGASGSW